jgi:hypothetical protein
MSDDYDSQNYHPTEPWPQPYSISNPQIWIPPKQDNKKWLRSFLPIILIIILLSGGYGIFLLINQHKDTTSKIVTISTPSSTSAISSTSTPLSHPTLPVTPRTCPTTLSQGAKSVPSALSNFNVTLPSTGIYQYIPSQNTENNHYPHRFIIACLPNISDYTSVIQSTLGTGWKKTTAQESPKALCEIACWSRTTQTQAGNSFTQYISLQSPQDGSPNVIIALTFSPFIANGSLSSQSTKISLEAGTASDFGYIDATHISIQGNTLVNTTLQGTLNTTTLSDIQSLAYSDNEGNPLEISVPRILSARTQNSRYAIIFVEPKLDKTISLQWVLFPGQFW